MSASMPLDPLPMPARPWGERAYQGVLTVSLGMLGFFAPFSTAGVYVAMALLLSLCVLAPARIWRTRFWREPVFALGLALLAYIALRSVLAGGFTMVSFHAANKYQELLLAPLLWALLLNARRPQAFASGLIAGALLLAGLYWTGAPRETALGNWLVLHRISAGFGLSVCAFLLFEHGRLGRLPRWPSYLAALALVATVLFAMSGRTGHLLVLLLAFCAAFRAAPQRARILTALAGLVVAIAVGAMSSSVRDRVLETLHDSEASSRGQVVVTSATTARLEVWQNAVAVAREHWLLGTGSPNYLQAVEQVSLRRHARPQDVVGARSDNPHNEYLMQLGAGGLPALLLFLLWLAWPVARAVREAGTGRPWSGAVGCVALAFAVGCLFNSLLLDFVEGHLYVALLAWLLVRRVED
jgi:O-antigen ligase